jgi:hypothetical protein
MIQTLLQTPFLAANATSISTYPSKKGGEAIGQLGFKEEAAGKLRVFAEVDSITQTLLSPLHHQLSRVLKKIGNDGTFDQDSSC